MQFYIAQNGVQVGPFTVEELRWRVSPDSLVWRDGMASWVPAGNVPELQGLFMQNPPPIPPSSIGYRAHQASVPGVDKKLPAGICGILIGGLGIHKFILGFTGAGLTMLLVTVLTLGIGGMVMGIIGLIEGITYLTKTDQEFYQTYIVERKSWF